MSTDAATARNANANTNILLIRHGEKPASGVGLDVAGQERAQAYVASVQNDTLRNAGPDPKPIKLDFLFASADSDHRERPIDTLVPLSQALRLEAAVSTASTATRSMTSSPGTS
jgi:hypothetical protein